MPLKPVSRARPRLAIVPPPSPPSPAVVELPRPASGGYDDASRAEAHRIVDAAIAPPRGPAKVVEHPGAYVTITISTYPRDLAKLDAMVAELKRRGFTKANRSALIRVALDQLDLDKVPRGI